MTGTGLVGNPVARKDGERRRKEIMRFIKKFIKKNVFSPTSREIAEGLGMSDSAVRSHLRILEAEKYIKTQDGKARTIKVLA